MIEISKAIGCEWNAPNKAKQILRLTQVLQSADVTCRMNALLRIWNADDSQNVPEDKL